MFASVLALLAIRPTPLHVLGNQLVEDGRPVTLFGVNVPSFEWSNEGEFVFRSSRIAFEDWKANCIRLPLSQDRWFGKADKQKDKGEGYQQAVNEIVNLAINRNRYIILDLHWSDANDWGKNLGQHDMPDEHSVQFWKEVASRYKRDSHVLFGLYNEPHDVSWSVWKDGGDVQEKDLHYRTPGIQALLDAIRKAGANNVCIAGGLDWAYDLTGVLNGGGLSDPKGNGVVYDAHIYPWKRDWEGKVGVASSAYPVLIGEAGCLPKDIPGPGEFVPKLFDFIRSHKLNWTAWCLHPTATPNLISDWVYTPTPFWGVPVKQELAKAADQDGK